jgi:N,N-dimethylformamidase
MRSTTIQDAAAGDNPLVLVNSPMRAVTSHSWDGTTLDWRTAPEHYAAAYFHDTDLDDARWARAGEISVPTGTRPGLYAVRCRADGGRADHAPLIVRDPATGTRVAMLLSTFTYLAYANNSTFKHQHFDEGVVVGRSQRDDQLDRHPMLGMSLYDKHSDGSGVSTSSALRPILTMRFDHRSSVQDTPRNLGADLLTASWLDRVAPGHGYLTDHDLHFAGAVPDGVEVLVTGTHPEYVSTQMLDALVAFQRRGGSLMYLGGNGFYWVTTCSAERPHLIEVRRGQSGIRTWESDPGEGGHATTGQPGGLWRHVGRPPNALVGVGMAAQGWDRRAPGYVRAPEAQGPVADRLFAGISDAVLGDFGYAMGGAAGDEVDRMDYDLGTPRDALRLLTSQRHSHLYKIAVEDIPMVSDQVDGTSTDRVRSDVCLMPTGSGGHVFSVGSITWASSLAWNDFDNNIAQFTLNALNFLLHG